MTNDNKPRGILSFVLGDGTAWAEMRCLGGDERVVCSAWMTSRGSVARVYGAFHRPGFRPAALRTT